MKLFLTIIYLFLYICGLAQLPIGVINSKVLTNSSFNWKLIDSKIDKSTKRDYLTRLFYLENTNYCENYSKIKYGSNSQMFSDQHWNNIHILDLDNDKDLDIIYDGKACPGFEAGQVDIYLNNKGKFEPLLEERGTVIDFNIKKKKIIIHSYPCCALRLNYIHSYSIDFTNGIKFNLDSIDLFAGRGEEMGNQILPSRLIKTTKIILTNDSTELRWSPNHKDFDILNTCVNNNTNIITKYPNQSIGYILGISNDSNWFFVKMKNNIKSKNYCITDIDKRTINDKPFNTYGWVEKKQTTYSTIYNK